jgi:hypothetical protein
MIFTYKNIAFLWLICVIMACNTKKNVHNNVNPQGSNIYFSKGVCSGMCSQYNIWVEDLTLRYEGVRNVERFGIFERSLSKEEKAALDLAFNNSSFFTMDTLYPVDISDFPMLIMSYSDATRNHKVRGRTEMPIEFRDLRNKLESLTNVGEWKTIKEYEKNVTNDVSLKMHTNENIIENQILIELVENASLGPWLRTYQKYGINLIRPMDQAQKIWLISYNTDKISPKSMIEILKTDTSVKTAEFNKILMPREH